MMGFPQRYLAFLALLLVPIAYASDDTTKPVKPCTITSPTSGSYYDLNGLTVAVPDAANKKHKDYRDHSWTARGYDYGANFTINFCAPVIEDLKDVVGLKKEDWHNVSAFYKRHGETYSIGQLSTQPVFRGRKLVFNYTDGSPCGNDDEEDALSMASSLHSRDIEYGGVYNNIKASSSTLSTTSTSETSRPSSRPKTTKSSRRRKSTIVSLLCERDTYDPAKHKVVVSFVGATPDHCAYFFEARSPISCGGVSHDSQDVGPGSLFSIIAGIALTVYLLGGIAYQRTVMHQRGWRQLPNYSLWASIVVGLRDAFFRLLSACAWPFRSRRAGGIGSGGPFGRLPTHFGPTGSGGTSRSRAGGSTATPRSGSGSYSPGAALNTRDDENRLIDQLDEEWED